MQTITVDIPTLLTPAAELIPRKVAITHGPEYEARRRIRRRSRWDPIETSSGFSTTLTNTTGAPRHIPASVERDQAKALVLRVRLEEIGCTLAANAAAVSTGAPLPQIGPRERSPSPPPVYDREGHRTNTREQRVREKLTRERAQIVKEVEKLVPGFRAPNDVSWRAPTRRLMKVVIPVKEYPDYNFIGLIIGPRGNTQKRLEAESGAKVSIRGRGSLQEGKSHKGLDPTEEDPLHVQITAESEDSLNKAYLMVKPLLMPMDEAKNEWKKAQLRELAEINGTLRTTTWSSAMMPDYDAGVTCAICGDQGHPTADCPYRGKGGVVPTKKKKLDSEFDAFMTEIGEAPPPKPEGSQSAAAGGAAVKAEAAFEEFLAEIGDAAGTAIANVKAEPNQPPPPMPVDQLPAAPPPPGSVPVAQALPATVAMPMSMQMPMAMQMPMPFGYPMGAYGSALPGTVPNATMAGWQGWQMPATGDPQQQQHQGSK